MSVDINFSNIDAPEHEDPLDDDLWQERLIEMERAAEYWASMDDNLSAFEL